MKLHPSRSHAAALVILGVLSGCGGGGGNSGSGGQSPTFPASGAFGWILKAAGPTDALKYGLSLVHPGKPDTEYVIELASSVVSDARLVASGSVDTGQLRATSIQPHALVYIVGGDVRSVPMQANGTAPLSRVQRSQSTSACRFVIEANDYATPQASRFIVSTAGGDGQCDTADDGRAEVQLSATLGVVYTPVTGEVPLDVVRDPATLAPRGWIYARSVALWGNGPPTTFATRAVNAPAVTGVIASTYNSALVEDGTQLSVLTFAGGSLFTETQLSSLTTGGSGWQSIGFDANSFYAYRNSGTTFNSTFTVLRITRSNPTVSVLATGPGLISLSSMGRDVLYLTVFGQADNRLIRLNKAGGLPSETVSPLTTFTSVQTSANGVHQLWRVTGVGSASTSYAVDIVNESNATLYTSAGGFPMSVAEASSLNFNASESRTTFVFAGGYADRAFGDATLVAYDTSTLTANVMGTLPGTADFGADFVYASTIGGPTSFGMGFAARSSNGSAQETGAKVFSYDHATPNSLKVATIQP